MRSWLFIAVLLIISALAVQHAIGQDAAPATTSAPSTQAATTTVAPADFFGAWVLLPPLITIALAILWQQVIPALAVGILIASFMLAGHAAGGLTIGVFFSGLSLALERFLLGALSDLGHAKVIVFTLMIGGMIGIIAANGGTLAIVSAVARWASNRRRGQVATWIAGLLVFFDDYANAMIVGPAMRPVCDRLKISRAKLAYLVDSTAAPVSSIALVGTWVGAEVGYIDDGLRDLVERPGCLTDVVAYSVFLNSIPYRFYPILALVMVLLIGLFDRDFGPMRKAERDLSGADDSSNEPDAAATGRAWYAGVPVLVLLLVTLAMLVITGWNKVQAAGAVPQGTKLIQEVITNAESYDSILYGAFAALLLATFISLGTRALTLAKTVDSALASMARMFPTMVVLVLAWTLSSSIQALQLGEVVKSLLEHSAFDIRWLPLLIFAAACVVSFATGTSWGTMGILCPATVIIAAGMVADLPAEQGLPLFYASVGAVLSGAVFGDHCSPISDTTVLSSLASGCRHELHVWTQMPYAVVVAVVSTLCGDLLCRYADVPAWGGLLAGSAVLVAIVLLIGRKPRPVDDLYAG